MNNTSLGAKASLVELSELDPKIIADCQKICLLMGRELAGIDFMIANDGSSRQVFLEVNAIPQLTSGSFVEEKLHSLVEAVNDYLKVAK